MRRLFATVAFLVITASSGSAQTPYLDDRSSAEALVRSLYNAVSRREYARAWSYFAEPPAESFDIYAEGYADTDEVIVLTGAASEEGAAGSVYYNLPVAIEARTADGDAQVYGGCYQMRLANPQLQGEDFAPLQIVSATLGSSSDSVAGALPERCGDAPAPEPATLRERQAREVYRDGLAGLCSIDDVAKEAPENFASWLISFSYSQSGADEPKSQASLYRFLCNRGAYNESHIYVLATDSGIVKPLGFATPELDIRYEDDDFEKPVDAIYIKGFRSAPELVNSQYDPATLTLTSWAMWRSVGDASTIGTWIFRDGEFALVRYDVDASYDGDVSHETVLDYLSGP